MLNTLKRYRILWLTLAIALCASLVLGQAQNFFNATQLQGVNISQTAPTNGQVLGYVSATKLWTPSTAAGGGGLSGMTAGQIPVAATATTVTSSIPVGSISSSCSGTATGVQYVCTTNLSSAQILALNATPVQLVAAPGAGKTIAATQVSAEYIYVTTAYTGATIGMVTGLGTNPAMSGGSQFGIATMGLVDQTANTFTTGSSGPTPIAVANSPYDIISIDTLTLGDGTLTVTVWYTVLAVT